MAEPVTDTPANSTDATDSPTVTPRAWSAVLRRLAVAFTFAKFRNMWLAAFTSAVGTWMQRLAKQLLILDLTGSAFLLGLDMVLAELPLLLFTLIGGLLIRRGLDGAGRGDWIDGDSIRRLTAVAMEFLVVAAIASLKLDAVLALAGPLAVLITVAVGWTALCLLWVGPRVLPGDRWMELGLINYGMSTGTTATGLMLLRIVDKDLETGAAEDYALAAPLSAPFVGGGLLTLMMPLLLQFVPLSIVAVVLSALVVLLLVVGRRL